MRFFPKLTALVLSAGLAVQASGAFAAETVEVRLVDRSDMMMAHDLGIGMGGDLAMASMAVVATPVAVAAGEVTFDVTNDSTMVAHEMVVIPLEAADIAPAYDETVFVIDEDAAGAIGEVEELAPGASGTVTLHLDPGVYLLVCNIPGHYAAGMWTILTVE